jgi:hypothetical protein
MASAAIHIANTLSAIKSGEIPGAFNTSRTEFAFPTLAYVGARGATHFWTIRVRLLGPPAEASAGEYVAMTEEMLDQPVADLQGLLAEITVKTMQQGGKERDVVPTYVSTGKNLGKKNATNALTQALRDALGLYNKQKKRADIVEAAPDGEAPEAPEERDTTVLEFDSMPPPMLVKKLGDTREASLTPAIFKQGVTLQRKFNGVHYVVFERTGPGGSKRLIRYSRSGTEYPGQEQVVQDVLEMYKYAPRISPGEYGVPALVDGAPATPDDERVLKAYGAYPRQDGGGNPAPYLDGELYLHGQTLNWISGQARRGDDKGLLNYHVFDVFFPYAKAAGADMPSRHRQAYLRAWFAAADAAGARHPHVIPVENFPVGSMEEVQRLAKDFLGEGYEGAIARKDGAGYRYSYSNYHSGNLMKIKPIHDAEFTVVGYTQGIKGKDVGAVLWECEVPKPVNPRDKTFTVAPKDMTYKMRYALFKCLGHLVEGSDGKKITVFEKHLKGLPLTVEYAELSTKTGKPLQPKALVFRTYEAGPGHDPVRRLLEECQHEASDAPKDDSDT